MNLAIFYDTIGPTLKKKFEEISPIRNFVIEILDLHLCLLVFQ